jgi:hypothetical protein
VGTRLVEQRDELPAVQWTFVAVASLAAAILLSGVPTVVAAVAMAELLKAGRICLSWRASFAVVGQAQIGKYLPGNVFQYLGRVALGSRRGVPGTALTFALGTETVLTIAVALAITAVGALADPSTGVGGLEALKTLAYWALATLAILAAVSLGVMCFSPSIRLWLRERRAYFQPRPVLTAAGLYVLVFVSVGVVLELLVRGVLGITSPWHWPQFTWRFALIWVLGLVTIGAPAGLGVREALMLIWFSPVLGESVAIGLAALLRLVTTLADVALFGLAWLLDSAAKRQDQS